MRFQERQSEIDRWRPTSDLGNGSSVIGIAAVVCCRVPAALRKYRALLRQQFSRKGPALEGLQLYSKDYLGVGIAGLLQYDHDIYRDILYLQRLLVVYA